MRFIRNLLWVFVYFSFVILAASPGVMAKDNNGDFSPEELAQMLAPVALYPDTLLSQVLMGATYPLEVVAADRWVKKNPLLKGDNLDEAMQDQDWDASIKALCHVPAVLAVMSERLEETTRLGDAFLAQEQAVMDTIQDLRLRARREGNLKANDKQQVNILDDGTIVIEPVDQKIVYVPYYNTRYVYGPWWYPAWPPWYWGPGEVLVGGGIYFWPDFYFGIGYWSRFDWPRRTIIIDYTRRPRFFRPDYRWDLHPGFWRHEPTHRRGVVYRDRPTAERFKQPPARLERAERQATRSRVRGPVTGSGGSNLKAEEIIKSRNKDIPERKNVPRPPEARGDNDAGKTERIRGGVAITPRSQPSPKEESPRYPPEKYGNARDEERGDFKKNREPGDDNGTGRESSYERRGRSGPEGRQRGTLERHSGSDDAGEGSARGGRR